MTKFNLPETKELRALLRSRKGEERLGASVTIVDENTSFESQLNTFNGKYVVLGIQEDVGVRANLGRGGAHTAFIPAMDSFLNQQSNQFLTGEDILIAGSTPVSDLMKKAECLDQRNSKDLAELRTLTAEIDNRVIEIMKPVFASGKIPIIIGGGHNNAYGLLAAASQTFKRKVNVVNCDAHTDMRAIEGRHSGNGFSYAYQNGFINRYTVIGLHEQYNNTDSLFYFKNQPSQFMFSSFEDIFVRENINMKSAIERSLNFVKDDLFGVELDLDSIANVPSSAKTSSGITTIQARQFVYQSAKQKNAMYLHIAEGAPVLAHRKADNKTGKLIAYLMSDFIKGNKEV
ncbi:MAG: arginase family protein [Bacteroidota bacterium]|nr:arginase family protein [Bacteroidota bacterium]